MQHVITAPPRTEHHRCGTAPAGDVLELFDAWCARRPDAVAVVDDRGSHSYARIDAESRGYAATLAAHGAGPETVVAVTAHRGRAYVAMVLGVLRAGAAFVPVEPNTPVLRAQGMCAAAGVRVFFAEPAHQGFVAEVRQGVEGALDAAVCLADPDPAAAEASAARSGDVRPHPDSLAYVLFTSGSTGVPKGAMLTRGGMANHSAAKVLDLDLCPGDVVGFTAPLSFDISVWQALTALTVGASVCVANATNLSEPARLAEWVERHRVTVLEIVPSFLTVVLDELESDARLGASLASLRMLIATGEALSGPLGLRWHRSGSGAALLNAYGPTECSDDVTHHVVSEAECASVAWPSIGREIINTRVYVVDEEGRETEASTQGDLWVGGVGVGRGYVGDPVRTALAFVPDHLSDQPGARLYRTGDRGDRADDGTVRYAGRVDRQVKVRGHRVELGDVEAQLLGLTEVAAAACVLTGGRLRAFVTLRSGVADPDRGAALLSRLRWSAPRWLVPHELTVLDRMPTTVAGKADHRALAALPVARGPVPGARTAEGSPSAGAGGATLDLGSVRALVAEVLGLAAIGPDEDFFAAGGDSLRAMTLISLARKRFGDDRLALRGFMGTPTPRGLLTALFAARAEPVASPAALPAGEAPGGTLSSGQERLWFLEQLHPHRTPLLVRLALTLRGPLDREALQGALNALVRRHEPLRTVFTSERGLPKATVVPEAEVPLIFVSLADAAEAAAGGLAPTASALSVRTARPPLMEARLVQWGPEEHRLDLVLHHLVCDGWSLGVLGREIGALYGQQLEGGAEPAPPATGYSRYVAEERAWLAGPEGRACEAYWTERLSGAPAEIALPFDRPRPASPDFTAAHVLHELTEAETRAVAELARQTRATPFMVVLSALYRALGELAGCDDLVVGIDAANRSWPGSEELIGTFVNQLPLRIALPAQGSDFRELVGLVRRESLAAYAQDRLPFHRIVAAANPPRRAGRFPLFQVKATQQGAWGDGPSLPGLAVETHNRPEPATDLDLMLDVSEEAGRLRLELVHRTELLDEKTAQTWVDAIARVLRTATEEK